VSVNVEAEMLAPFMSRENSADTVVPTPTAVAPAAGVDDVTVGASGADAAVVNVHDTAPARPIPPLAVIAEDSVALYVVASASWLCGTRVAVCVDAS
jgi:hypothetical protein